MNAIGVYDKLVLERPALTVAALLGVFALFGYGARDFRLDASADSLVVESDQDLRYYREVSAGYEAQDFLIITYTPSPPPVPSPSRGEGEQLFSDEVLARVKGMREELKALEPVATVVTLLDVPLLRSPPVTLKELRDNIRTLESADVDREAAPKEFAASPVYRNLLVSSDLKSTAILVNLKRDEAFENLSDRRMQLREKRRGQGLNAEEKAELKKIKTDYREEKDRIRLERHRDIKQIREVMDHYRADARLFLGGAPMVVDDMISYIKSDIAVFGVGVLLFLVVTLWVIFRRKRWVLLPVLCCAAAAVVMVGILGFLKLDVTVVSSNFISLQLIMTMSFAIHIIGRYQELVEEQPGLNERELIRETVRTIFGPSSFSCWTTIAGFASLLVCDILPVVNFGWMMSVGLLISLAVVFLLLPAMLRFFPKAEPRTKGEAGIPVTTLFANLTERHRGAILAVSAVVVVGTGLGMALLTVENAFINYFKEKTEINKGMTVIDRELGGTTPLEIILRFNPPAAKAPAEPAEFPGAVSKSDEKDFELMDEATEPSGADTPSAGLRGQSAAQGAENTDEDFDLMDEEPASPAEADKDFDLLEGGPAEAPDPARYWFTTDKIDTVERVHDYLESLPVCGKVLSLATVVKMMRQLEGQGQTFDNFELALIYTSFPKRFKKILVDPWVSYPRNEARIMVRMKDSMPELRRDEFLKQTKADLEQKLGLKPDQFHLTGLMVLYNNMLQSLYTSQIKASSLTILPVFIMFLLAFRSFKTALIAMVPNIISTTLVLGVMGLAGLPLDVMTITIVSIGLGMGVEDTILYIHRFREEILKDRDYVATMRRCHLTVGNPMYYTSVVVTLGFSILALSNFIPTIMFGVLTAATMVIAFVSATTLLPTLIILLKPFGPSKTA